MMLKLHRRLDRMGLSRRKLRGGWLHHWIGDHLFDKSLWRLQREGVARACLLGFPIACSPFMGFHILVAMPLGFFLRANLPVIFAIQLLTNIFTLVVYFPAAYVLGCRLTSENPTPHYRQLAEVISHGQFDLLLSRDFLPILWPLFVGCTVFGLVMGGLGYVLVMSCWPARWNAVK